MTLSGPTLIRATVVELAPMVAKAQPASIDAAADVIMAQNNIDSGGLQVRQIRLF